MTGQSKTAWYVVLSTVQGFHGHLQRLGSRERNSLPHCVPWAIAHKELQLTPECLSCSLLAGIFGQRLEDTVQYERKYGQRLAPLLVEQCVDFIRERGLTEEGLFRMPGQANLVKDLQDSFDCGEKPLFDRWVYISKFRLVYLWHAVWRE